MPQNEQSDERENPYAAPLSSLIKSEGVSSEDPEVEELSAFAGSKADYYLKQWTPLLRGLRPIAGFNWAAALGSGFWIGYRKMYKVAAIFFGIILLETLAEEVLFVGILGKEETPVGLVRLVGLAAAVVCGVYGNRWYLWHARKVISEVRADGMQRDAYLDMISKRGGTSLGSAFGIFFLFLVVSFLAVIILEFLIYPI